MKKIWVFCLLSLGATAQYLTPPKPLADLVIAPPTPSVSVDSKGQWMVILSRETATSTIAELSEPELKLAGVRLNPANFGPSRATYINGMSLRRVQAGSPEISVKGLPASAKISQVQWSPDDSKIALAVTSDSKIELYVIDVATAQARLVTSRALHSVLGGAFEWFSDNQSLLVKTVPTNRGQAPEVSRIPAGPTIQENAGTKAQAATYQDLLKNASDEAQFDYYATAEVYRIGLDGSEQKIAPASLVVEASTSPDGQYILIESVHRPFSYLVTVNRFPKKTEVYSRTGQLVRMMFDAPLQENVPWGADAAVVGPRGYNWRNDAPATLYWVEAQDGGDPKKKVDVRDIVYTLDAPFSGTAKELYKATYRFGGITWGTDQVAFASERWFTTRKAITQVINPSAPGSPSMLFDRSSEDRYNNPGSPELKKNAMGRNVLDLQPNGDLMYIGLGSSPEGDRPFVDRFNLITRKAIRLWRSEAPYFERPITVLDAAKGLILTSRESNEEVPNYFIRNLNPAPKKGKKPAENPLTQITDFPHPYPQFKGIQKQQLRYKRSDGVDLTATLLLPVGYKKEDGPLPTFLWAYPAEFKSAAAASQVSGSPYTFNRISYWTGAAFVTMGYAVLENASIPIVGEGDAEPNDTYIEQLVASAQAAIDEGVRLGVVDPKRVGVGGHSYGAFMTANLLTHTNLFKAGIARSGAYNRTLTPFGFQNEQRTYWQAPAVYNKMSPFMNADKMKTPLLMTHGEADNNTGTFPIQSERYYNALKGMGATVKLVTFPYESHGYTAKESLLHLLHEMNAHLEKYVKNAK